MTSPCKNCPDRHPECHSECKRFAEWRDTRNAVMEYRAQIKRKEDVIYAFATRKKRKQ